jgi:large subunit ribosomal protein L25
MRKEVTIQAEARHARGKNEARRLRRSGKIPAVVYGAYQEPVAVTLDPRDLSRIIHSPSGYNSIFDVAFDGQNAPVMIADHQNHPITGVLMHADLKRIDLNKRITVTVPVYPQGEAKGVKQQGGLFEMVSRSVQVECLPNDIPEQFTIDVTELLIGQNVRASDIAMPGSMQLVSPPEAVIVHVVPMRGGAVEETEAAAAAEPATPEPEVVKKGKKEEAAPEEKGKKK